MGRGWTGVGHYGDGSVHPSGGGGSFVELWVGDDNQVSWGNIEFREEMGEGSGVVGS